MNILALKTRWLCKIILMACLTAPVHADDKLGFEIKAAYLYQIINYTHWDEPRPASTICLISPVNIESHFLSIEGKLFNEQAIRIKHFTTIEELHDDCILLYFAPGSEEALAAWTNKTNPGVITVSDNQLLNGELAMIQLLRKATKLKFAAHNSIAIENNVTFSSRLLRVADYID